MAEIKCGCNGEYCSVEMEITGEIEGGLPVIYFRAYDDEMGRRGNQCVPAHLLRDWVTSGTEEFEYEDECGTITIGDGEFVMETPAWGYVMIEFEEEGIEAIVKELELLGEKYLI